MTIEDIIKYHETRAKELVEGFEALGHAQAARLLRGLSVVQTVEQWARDDALPAELEKGATNNA